MQFPSSDILVVAEQPSKRVEKKLQEFWKNENSCFSFSHIFRSYHDKSTAKLHNTQHNRARLSISTFHFPCFFLVLCVGKKNIKRKYTTRKIQYTQRIFRFHAALDGLNSSLSCAAHTQRRQEQDGKWLEKLQPNIHIDNRENERMNVCAATYIKLYENFYCYCAVCIHQKNFFSYLTLKCSHWMIFEKLRNMNFDFSCLLCCSSRKDKQWIINEFVLNPIWRCWIDDSKSKYRSSSKIKRKINSTYFVRCAIFAMQNRKKSKIFVSRIIDRTSRGRMSVVRCFFSSESSECQENEKKEEKIRSLPKIMQNFLHLKFNCLDIFGWCEETASESSSMWEIFNVKFFRFCTNWRRFLGILRQSQIEFGSEIFSSSSFAIGRLWAENILKFNISSKISNFLPRFQFHFEFSV